MSGGKKRVQNGTYQGDYLSRVAFPLGGIGAGMVCLEGTGALSHVSLRHKPEVFNEPLMFSALHVKGAPTARVLEGPVPKWKAFGAGGTGNGGHGKSYGLPRFAECAFETRFPFGIVKLSDKTMPVSVELTGWSPFTPGDADSSSLPVLALEYTIKNISTMSIEAVYSFHAANFMSVGNDLGACVRQVKGGFALVQPPVADKPAAEGSFAAFVDESSVKTDCAWFRGGWFDPLTMLWNTVMRGGTQSRKPHSEGKQGNGGSLFVPFSLKPKAAKTVRLLVAWHVPGSDLRVGSDPKPAEGTCSGSCACGSAAKSAPAAETHAPWYASRFASIDKVIAYWRKEYVRLHAESATFSDCFYDSTLPPEVVEAIAANLTILKSPTCLRQKDGRFWAWEGCCDGNGCCHGSCTHVWNYAQAMPHLFPSLERSLRETEFGECQDERGHQNFRAALPIRPVDHGHHAAADGQLGGIMKVHREWRISGDTKWLTSLWPKVKQSIDYCIATWDPDHKGLLVEPHHNTYDIEFWGADGMCSSFYLGALAAASAMGKACGSDVSLYESLLVQGRKRMEADLWNGDYFIQKIQWKNLRAADPSKFKALAGCDSGYSKEAIEVLKKEGPKYQYGDGCLSDGVLGDWIARCCGVDSTLSPAKVRTHLAAVFKHNFKADLSSHSNPQRPTYAIGDEAGLLLASWPKGGKLSLPFVYSDEVWTGIEYQVASHLIMLGRIKEGLAIVQAVRERYDGRVRNPFNEYECGHWYARAMASYGLLQSFSGARYDALDKTLRLSPAVKGDFRCFLATAAGYGVVGVRKGKPFLEVKSGKIPVKAIVME